MNRNHFAHTLDHLICWMMPCLMLVAGGMPVRAAEESAEKWTPAEMMRVSRVGNVRISSGGDRVVYTVAEAIMDEEKSEYLTHIYMAKTDGSETFRFTSGEQSANNPRWSPDDRFIAFTSSRSGKSNLWLIRAGGGEAVQLTDAKTGVGDFRWSPDGEWIAFTMADAPSEEEEQAKKAKDDARVIDEDMKTSHLWLVPVRPEARQPPEARQLTKGAFHVSHPYASGFDWSPDGKTIAFTHTATTRLNDWPLADVSTVAVDSGEVRSLVATGAVESGPVYSPDGTSIAYLGSDDPPTWAFTADIYVVSAMGGTPRRPGVTFDRQPNIIGWSPNGREIYYSETVGTLNRLATLPVKGGAPKYLDSGDRVLFGANLNRTGTMLGFSVQTTAAPPEAYVTGFDRYKPMRVSHANDDLPDHPLGRTEVIRWKSSDQMEIEGLLTYPIGYEPGNRVPLLLVIHGGPTGVYLQTFIGNSSAYPIAAFAADGFAVLRCNIRGSSGYGKAFRYANYGDWGGGDYRDLMAGVDHVIDMGVADPDRLGVMGWSYGGYMTSWIITQTDRFKAASAGAPVTNLMSFNGTADIPDFVPDYFDGDFWDRPEAYSARSAMFQIKGVTTPTLVQHGERDVRVPTSQGYELYNALKRQGVETKMIVYPRTPHGLREPKFRRDAMRWNLKWFNRHLMEKTGPGQGKGETGRE